MMQWIHTLRWQRFVLVAVLGCVTGCAWLVDAGPVPETAPDEEQVWVQRIFTGGQQCVRDPYTPPDTAVLLRSHGVRVYDVAIEMLAVCAACGCPAYAAIHYARIAEGDLARAEAAGFEHADEDEPPVRPRPRRSRSPN